MILKKIKNLLRYRRIPKHLDECFEFMKRDLEPEDIEAIKKMKEDDTYMLHFGLGMYLRNEWGLWEGSELTKYFNNLGISHPDDMSGIILTSFWRLLNNKPLGIDEQVKKYKEYWESIKIQYPNSFKNEE